MFGLHSGSKVENLVWTYGQPVCTVRWLYFIAKLSLTLIKGEISSEGKWFIKFMIHGPAKQRPDAVRGSQLVQYK